MPLPTTRVIHPDWSAHHRPVATGTHTAECTITRPATTGTTADDGTWTPPPQVTVYTGPCRVTPRPTSQRFAVAGGRRVVLREYVVAIDWDAGQVCVDDLVEVSSAADPLLAGVSLRVADVQMGSQQWERVLVAVENLTEVQ